MVRKTKTESEEILDSQGSNERNVGSILKESRTAKNLSLEDVSKTLCITKSFLVRLENHSEALPVDVYTLGFLKSYAKFLGLNAEDIAEQFKMSNAPAEKVEELTFPKPLPKRGIPHVRVVSISLAFAFLLVVGWETITKMSPSTSAMLDVEKVSQETPVTPSVHAMADVPHEDDSEIIKVAAVEVPAEQAQVFIGESQESSTSQAPETHDPQNNTPPQNTAPAHIQSGAFEAVQTVQPDDNDQSVTLSFSEESWVQIKDAQGQVVVNRTFKPGEHYDLNSPQGHTLRAGNAGGINLIVAGKDMGKLGTTGQVMGNISLDPEKLLAQPVETH